MEQIRHVCETLALLLSPQLYACKDGASHYAILTLLFTHWNLHKQYLRSKMVFWRPPPHPVTFSHLNLPGIWIQVQYLLCFGSQTTPEGRFRLFRSQTPLLYSPASCQTCGAGQVAFGGILQHFNCNQLPAVARSTATTAVTVMNPAKLKLPLNAREHFMLFPFPFFKPH